LGNQNGAKEKKGAQKSMQNKSLTEKQKKFFATVLASTENRDKPFVCLLETVVNEFQCFSRKINLDTRELFN